MTNQYNCSYCRDSYCEFQCKKCKKTPLNACKECHYELAHNIIVNQNVNFFGGGSYSSDGDPSPAQENAVRHLEDGR